MTDVEFSRDDITSLAKALSELQSSGKLTPLGRVLLLAIFANAVGHATPVAENTYTLPLPEVREQDEETVLRTVKRRRVSADDLLNQLQNAYLPCNDLTTLPEVFLRITGPGLGDYDGDEGPGDTDEGPGDTD